MDEETKELYKKLEAEPLLTNKQLLEFDLRSGDIDWKEHIVPLQARSEPVYLQRQFNELNSYREPIGEHNRRELLVCHDMMGNYLEDRHYNSSKKYDDYRFYHWAAVDYFCYFSHQYVTIPPCGWINAAHKHGVRVLGTYIVEGAEGSAQLHELLASRDIIEQFIEALVRLCLHFGYEGWLVNIECKVDAELMENLYYMLERLRTCIQERVASGTVFWYDSVIETGELLWQNEINDKNVRFFRAADAMLLNYTWKSASLEATAECCAVEEIRNHRAFVGIDVFGRGQLAKFQSKETLAHIVKHRFSTGIFAPGWTFETLQQYSYDIKQPLGCAAVNKAFLRRNEKFWWCLWQHLATHPYKNLPFETDFCLGSGVHDFVQGVKCGCSEKEEKKTTAEEDARFFNLTRQSLQPSVPLHDLAERYYADAFNGGSSLRILKANQLFRVFMGDFRFQRGGLVFAYAYKMQNLPEAVSKTIAEQDKNIEASPTPPPPSFDCVLRICAGNNSRDCQLYLGDYAGAINVEQGHCQISPFNAKYNELLTDALCSSSLALDLNVAQSNGWQVRYYVAAFDGPVQVKDIGVLYRKSCVATVETTGTAEHKESSPLLGAVFLNEFDINAYHFPVDSNIALLQIYGNDLLN